MFPIFYPQRWRTTRRIQTRHVKFRKVEAECETLSEDSQSDDSVMLETDDGDGGDDEAKFLQELRQCFGDHRLTRQAQEDILDILRRHGHPYLPRTSRTLMQTPRSVKKDIQSVSNGSMFYLGIAWGVEKLTTPEYLEGRDTIELDFSWDGLQPYKSVKRKVWPILCRLASTRHTAGSEPFIVGMFCGSSDPKPEEFLKDFVKECKDLETNGISINERKYNIKISKIIADQPARARFKVVCGEGPRSLIQCERCTVVAKTREHRATFSSTETRSGVTLRTDESFREKHQPEYHNGDSPLLALNIDMIFAFPLDPMHVLYQGVVRHWWEYIVEPKFCVRYHITKKVITPLSKFMKEELGPYFSCEFARRVRGLDEYKLYKATEWRRFLLYDGIVVVKKFLPLGAYKNFLLLFCAIRILSSREHLDDEDLFADAESLLNLFVADAENKFGKIFLVGKVHGLTHLARDCKEHGELESFSAFPFESYLHRINTAMNAPGRCLEQIVCRIKEGHLLHPKQVSKTVSDAVQVSVPCGHYSSGSVAGEEFHAATLPGMTIRTDRKGDAHVKTVSGDIVRVANIIKAQSGEVFIIGYRYLFRENFFHYPLKSSKIGVELIWGVDSHSTKVELQELKCKCVLLPYSGKWVCLPLVHGCEDDSMA